MTTFKCAICGREDDLDMAVHSCDFGLICQPCDKTLDDIPPSGNTCVCCGEVIPEGLQVCTTCLDKVFKPIPKLKIDWGARELKESGIGDAIARGFAEGIENPRTDERIYVDDIDFSSINKILSIHKIIDDAMEKRDRTVSIFISAENNAVSVNVYPVEQDKVKWIYREDSQYCYNFECSNCGMTSEFQTTYCPSCGEQTHGVRRVEHDASTTV